MPKPKPTPLYPTYAELESFSLVNYPDLKKAFYNQAAWLSTHWEWGKSYLDYIGKNKSIHTYNRFRNEVERFLLWSFFVKKKPIDDYRKSDILEYIDFCWKPPVSWIATSNNDRFILKDGFFKSNSAWRPFKIQAAKSQSNKAVDVKEYRPSQQSLTAIFTAIISFYKYLMDEEKCYGNPAQTAKKDCRHFITDVHSKDVMRLTEEQWQYVLNSAIEMADQDTKYERNLFIVSSLKTLFLRISEISERENWTPIMSHFSEDDSLNVWLKVFGKNKKLRKVSVPNDFLPFLERYRLSRGLSPFPSTGDNKPLVEKIRGQGGMSSRHLTRLVQETFDFAYSKMKKAEGEKKAMKLKEASTHWLRHTGASMEIERGRALKDLSEDLGHASMATTDTKYVHTEDKKRAESGSKRKVL